MIVRTAMILAAGLGTRLRPLTDTLPKPLVPVGDAPAIVQIQRHLAAQGIGRVVINSHHLAAAFGGVAWPLPTTLLHETRILGTAGGVANAREQLAPGAPLLVWNGDILAEIDVDALFAALPGAAAVWSVAPRPAGEGTVGLDEQGRVVRLRTFRSGIEARGGDFLGVYVLSPEVLYNLPPEGCMAGDVLGPMLERGGVIQTVDHEKPWDDIGSLPAYLHANLRWLGERSSFVGPGARVDAPVNKVVVGAGAEVQGEGLERVVVWPGAKARGPLRDAIVLPPGRVIAV